MGQSNEAWGALASHNQELADEWDRYERLPDAGEDEALDAFVDRKNITINALVRLGVRIAEPHVLAFPFPGGVKYRDIVTDRRWSSYEADWTNLRLVPGRERDDRVLVCEGETDGAWLSENYPCDVAIMPAGALYFPETYAEQLASYKLVLVALDRDEAGERGAAQIVESLVNAMRFVPPGKDWCADSDQPPPPLPFELERDELRLFVPAGELVTMEVPDHVSWFEQAVLPVGGLLVLHGAYKSYKSFLVIDMMAALAQCQDWAGLEPTEEPAKVAILQWEITWPFYQKRIKDLRTQARNLDLYDTNLLTYTPLIRPELVIGNKAQEDKVLHDMVDEGVQIVAFDPVRRVIGAVDFNSEEGVRPLLAYFERLNREGITVVATHHDNKEASRKRGGDPLDMTGSGAFAGDPDTLVSVELPRNQDINSRQRNLYFTLRNSPAPKPRGMEMQENGYLLYNFDTFGTSSDEDEDAPKI